MKKNNVVHVVGARPNFMKLAPVYSALTEYKNINQSIIHTGQHYDYNMSDIFFEQFKIPKPDVNLNISGSTVLQQIGNGIISLEKALPVFNAQLVIIYGDINATAYTSIVCSKLGVRLAHVEAGLRSFDRTMPEETNRILADALSDYYFTPSIDADVNLLNEGAKKEKIFLVGNVMIDTLVKFLPKSYESIYPFQVPDKFGLVTLHRPSNVDDKNNLNDILNCLEELNDDCKLIFPVHPRTKNLIPSQFYKNSKIIFTEPLSYLQFLNLQKKSKFIITDSGGIQEESTFLGIPCFTYRNNTERPVTINTGTNILAGTIKTLKTELNKFFKGEVKSSSVPELWDGLASIRIAKIINNLL